VLERPVFIGMTNPLSDDPARALWPQPDGCTGHRLWLMATAGTGISQEEWIEMTDRRNLCIGEWDRRRAMARGAELAQELADRTVVLLGVDAVGCTRILDEPLLTPLEWSPLRRWTMIPHPSGLNRWYNNHAHRAAVECRLADIIIDYTGDQ